MPPAEVVQRELNVRVQAMTALQRLIISARADGERLLHMRRTAAQHLTEARAWLAPLADGEARPAQACCTEWQVYIGHVDRDITYRRQLIIDYHREWQSYRETLADTALRRAVLGQVTLPPLPPLLLMQAAADERTYTALGRSPEAPTTADSGFARQPEDMDQVNCDIACLESNEAAALAHRPPASCHSVEPYGRRAADDRDDEEGAASYGEGAAHYAGAGAGASSSSAASTPGYTAAMGAGHNTSAAGQRDAAGTTNGTSGTSFLAQYGGPQAAWALPPAFNNVYAQTPAFYGLGSYTQPTWPAPTSLTPTPWMGQAASGAAHLTPPGWPLPADQPQATVVAATDSEDARPRLHGLLAPNQQDEVELGALAAMIETSVEGFTGQTGLAAFTRQLITSLQSLHSFDSLALLLTKVCEPVQTAWITHDRNREDTVNIEFFRVLTGAKEN